MQSKLSYGIALQDDEAQAPLGSKDPTKFEQIAKRGRLSKVFDERIESVVHTSYPKHMLVGGFPAGCGEDSLYASQPGTVTMPNGATTCHYCRFVAVSSMRGKQRHQSTGFCAGHTLDNVTTQ
jgi:hypothetical protein